MTTPRDILSEVKTIFVQVFNNPSIVVHDGTTAADIAEWDSLNHTVLISAVQQHFAVKFTLREIMKFQNVGDMCAVIRAKLGA